MQIIIKQTRDDIVQTDTVHSLPASLYLVAKEQIRSMNI